MTFIYLVGGGPNGATARVQGTAYDARYLATYRRWPGCYAVLWQPTGTILAECRTEKRADWLAEMLYNQFKLRDRRGVALADIADELAGLIQGWHRIYPDEQPTKPRKRPARAGWELTPYRVQGTDRADGAWELSGYTRGTTGAVEVRSPYGMVVDLTHLPTGFLYGHVDCWPLATILADVMAAAIPSGTFGVAPPSDQLRAAHQAVQAARQEYADALSAERAA